MDKKRKEELVRYCKNTVERLRNHNDTPVWRTDYYKIIQSVSEEDIEIVKAAHQIILLMESKNGRELPGFRNKHQVLGRMGCDVLPELMDKTKNKGIRVDCVEAISWVAYYNGEDIRVLEAVPLLVEFLTDETYEVRLFAASALARICREHGNDERVVAAIPHLKKLLKNKDWHIVACGRQALELISWKSKEYSKSLKMLVESERKKEREKTLKKVREELANPKPKKKITKEEMEEAQRAREMYKAACRPYSVVRKKIGKVKFWKLKKKES